MDDFCYLTAEDALGLFRARTLSPVELMAAVLERAEAVEPVVNALPLRYPEEAMAAARSAEARYSAGEARALEGLPVAIKDSTELAGQPTSLGSLTTSMEPASRSSITNQRILDAGGIPHARSATPEFSSAYVCWSRKWGVTRNPWNPDYTPGGSSGGAAASLAAGTAVLATGSDIAGSIRLPAACCGVVGLKPTHGRVPIEPPFNMDPYCHEGPMARSVGDLALFQNVIAGPDPRDPRSLEEDAPIQRNDASIRGWTVGYSLDLGGYPIDDEVRRATEAAVQVFRDLGATVIERDPGWGAELTEAARKHLRRSFGARIHRRFGDQAELMSPYARAFAKEGAGSLRTDAHEADTMRERAGRAFSEIMRECIVFLAPTTAIPAVPAEFDSTTETLEIGGIPVDPMLGWGLTVPFNMLSSHPVLSVPSGRAASGVPMGIQIVARPHEEWRAFRAAFAYEVEVGGWYRGADCRPAPIPS